MKIDTSKVVFEATVSDELFFWLVTLNENGPAPQTELFPEDYFHDSFAWEKRGQLLMLGGIGSASAQAEYEELCKAFNAIKDKMGYIHIAPEHPAWKWDDVITYDTMPYETWRAQQHDD